MMIEEKVSEVREFFTQHANSENVQKFSRYFKEGFRGYGVDLKVFEQQKRLWFEQWDNELTFDDCLALGENLVSSRNYEEISLAILLVASKRKDFKQKTFLRLSNWFEIGIDNWAGTDVLCMFVLKYFLLDGLIDYSILASWSKAESEWQRRCVPVTLNELIKTGLSPDIAFPLVEPLMLDKSEYVQKGIGTLLRGLWQKYPHDVEGFLLLWKDCCGRIIIRYATEKMDKEKRKKFARSK